jgi:DNA-binding transcriptional ArsR family regulator
MRGLEHPSLDAVDLATLLDALGDPVRLDIVRQLASSGGVVCGSFDVDVSMPTLSHHLKLLRHAGVVRVSPEGRFRRYGLRRDDVEERFPGVLDSIIASLSFTTSAHP